MSLVEEGFLDRLYEAAAVPELWPDVLDRVNALAGTAGSLVLSIRDRDVRWMSTDALVEPCTSYIERGYIGRDERTVRLMKADHPGFLRDLDVFSLEEWEQDPIRRDIFVPAGLGWGIATNIGVQSGDALIIHGERRLEDGPPTDEAVALLDRLRPHLARAALLSSRLAFERMSAAATALAVVGIPAAALDARGHILAANELLEALSPATVQLRPTRLGLSDRAADERLTKTLEALQAAPLAAAQTQSIPIPASADRPAAIVHVYPIRRQARDIFTGATSFVLVMPVGLHDVVPAPVLQGLFDLTAAEARLARAIGQGKTIAEYCAASGLGVATARTQLSAVFEKTGLSRQAELTGLLQGLHPRI